MSSALEQLEHRRLLTVYVISSTNDGPLGAHEGELTLREAIVAASTNAPHGDAPAGEEDGDVIVFDESLAGAELGLDGGLGPLRITDDLLLNVDGPSVTLRMFGGRILEIDTDQAVTIANLALIEALSDSPGGAMRLDGGGTTMLDTLVFRANAAFAVAGGGAIFNADHDLTIISSTFEGNIADVEVPGPGSGDSFAGAINSSGSLTIIDSTFLSNSAEGAGGAIHATGNVSITGSTFQSNSAQDATPGHGGAIRFAGGTLLVEESVFTENIADAAGGAIWIGADSEATIRNDSQIIGNLATLGGGIFNGGGTLVVDFSDVFENHTSSDDEADGGGIYSDGGTVTVSSSQVKRNTSRGDGGGLAMVGGDLTLFFSDFSDNVAGQDASGNRFAGHGGGLHLMGVTAELESSKLEGNLTSEGGAGGGLWMSSDSNVSINMTYIANNSASGSGGGIFSDGGQLAFSRSRAWENRAGADTGSGDGDDEESDGGGIYVGAGGTADVSVSSIRGNASPRFGGGIFNDARLTVTFTAINNNFAGEDGGGIFTDDEGDTELIDAFLFNNDPNDLAGPGN